MKINVCSCCGKIIENNAISCKTCGSHYCSSCNKQNGDICTLCGKR